MENGESELSLWEVEKETEEKPKKSRRKAKEKSEMYREWQSEPLFSKLTGAMRRPSSFSEVSLIRENVLFPLKKMPSDGKTRGVYPDAEVPTPLKLPLFGPSPPPPPPPPPTPTHRTRVLPCRRALSIFHFESKVLEQAVAKTRNNNPL
uniref:Uncharacterized protein n=1 Tax=Vespula pensylvanica TaxID=30213 RepID=A0A836ULX7_VESPE|nr:hypothetical protein H0235_014803 [Vespula pensylvanica]